MSTKAMELQRAMELQGTRRGTLMYEILSYGMKSMKSHSQYCAEAHGVEYDDWLIMCGLGFVTAGEFINQGADRYFTLTPVGLAYLKAMEAAKGGGSSTVGR